MPTIIATDRDARIHRIEGAAGSTLKDVLVEQGGLDIAASCGGFAMCGTCHVYVDAAWLGRLGAMDDTERATLEQLRTRTDNSRLACQNVLTEALDGIQLTLAPKE